MKQIFRLSLLVTLVVGMFAGSSRRAESDECLLNVFLFAGQSNMAGADSVLASRPDFNRLMRIERRDSRPHRYATSRREAFHGAIFAGTEIRQPDRSSMDLRSDLVVPV